MKTIEQVIAIFGGKPEDWERHVKGEGWKQKTARVDPTAYLGPDTIVYGTARVSGDAQVFGNARVFGNAQVYGDAWEKSPLYIQGTKHACYWAKKGYLGIGCKVYPIAKWMEQYKEIGKKRGYSEEEISEYSNYIELFNKMKGLQ